MGRLHIPGMHDRLAGMAAAKAWPAGCQRPGRLAASGLPKCGRPATAQCRKQPEAMSQLKGRGGDPPQGGDDVK